MHFIRHYLIPAGLLAGAIIGAGVFALPYVFRVAGLSLGFFYLFLGALVYGFIHLLYADMMLRTPGEHRFAGYARFYFGMPGFVTGSFLTLVQMLFVMTIYLILSISFGQLLFPGGSAIGKLIVFWIIGSSCLFIKLRRLALLEALITAGIVSIIGYIFILGIRGYTSFPINEIVPNFSQPIFPLGPVLFSLSGLAAIPSLVRYFRRRKAEARHIRRVIFFGTLLPAVVYGLFVVGILGLTPSVTEDAVSGLVGAVSPSVIAIVGILGLLSILSSYIVVGIDVRDILAFDLRIPAVLRAAAVIAIPPLLYAVGFQDFLTLVSFIGGTFLAVGGMFVVLLWTRAERRYPDHRRFLNVRPAALAGFFIVLLLALISQVGMFLTR